MSTITDEKPVSTVTEKKTTTINPTDRLPAPAVAQPTRSTYWRPGFLSRKWEALLIAHFALNKAIMPTLHFWLYTAATTLLLAVIAAMPRERTEGMMPTLRAAAGVCLVRPSWGEDNFWHILYNRVCATVAARYLVQLLYMLVLLPVVGYIELWPGVDGHEVVRHSWVRVIYEIASSRF